MRWIWQLLGDNSKEISALSSIVFGVSSACVAWFAYHLNRKGNLGMKPLVLVPTLGGCVDRDTNAHHATFKGEIWNRRKYAIRVKMIAVRFRSVDANGLLAKNHAFHGDWLLMSNGKFVLSADVNLAPGEHLAFDGKFPASLGADYELPWIRVAYFDPLAGGTCYARGAVHHRLRWFKWRTRYRLGRFFAAATRFAARIPEKLFSWQPH